MKKSLLSLLPKGQTFNVTGDRAKMKRDNPIDVSGERCIGLRMCELCALTLIAFEKSVYNQC